VATTDCLPLLIADGDDVLGWIFKALIVLFFIGLPIVRSIREAIAKQKEMTQRRADAPLGSETDPRAQMAEARRRWEALVRGEEAPAVPRAAPPAPAPVARPTAAEASSSRPLSGPLSDLRPAPTEDEVEAANDESTADSEHFVPDEEAQAREENDRRLREERESRSAFLQRERESGAGRRANVAADAMTSLGAPTAAARIERAVRPQVLFGDLDSALVRKAALRRAIVAAEVLGPPVALRDPATGPVGMRRPA
jgi:hypothetical protein